MRILFSNDDGYDAVGINALYREFASDYDVRMCAPLLHKSAFSHAINYQGNLEVVKLSGDVKGYALDGTPADCAKSGIEYFFKGEPPFDAVLSGINFGLNIGRDVFYSGTMGAAREASFLNVCGVAFSQQVDEDPSWDNAPYFRNGAAYCRQIFEAMPKELLALKEIVFNINLPKTLDVKGVRMAALSKQNFDFKIRSLDMEGTQYITYRDTEAIFPDVEGTDYYWLKRGYISVSALYQGVLVDPKAQKAAAFLEKLTLKRP